MAEVEIIRYQCDVCKKEIKNKHNVEHTNIPCFGGERNEYRSEAKIDMCEKCADNLRNIIFKHFAEIQNYYGVHIKDKQRKEV